MSAATGNRSPGRVERRAAGRHLLTVTYNDKHQVLTATDAAGQTTTYAYNAAGQVLTVTSAKNETATYAYDTDGKLTSATEALPGATTTFQYDAYGRVWKSTDSDNYTVTMEYDALDRPIKTSYPDGTYEETVYNRLDPEKHRDRLGRWSFTFHDALRRVVTTRDAAGRTTAEEWGARGCSSCGGGVGQLVKLVDPNGNETRWEYDIQGRKTKEIRANGAQYSYTYENTTSRPKTATDPKGNVKTYAYTLDNKLTGISYTEAAGTAPTPDVSFTYDPVYGRPSTAIDGTGTTTYTYHPVASPPTLGAGKLLSVDGPLDNDTITYGYDELGRIVSRQIGGPSRIETHAFDALGRLTTLTNPLGAFTYIYDGVTGRPTSVTYPNGQQTTYAYLDNLGDHRLQEIHNTKPGGATLSKFNYTYDAVGNILTWRQQTESEPAKVYELGYDQADQLTAAILKSTDPTPQILKRYYYGYDPAGNRTAEQIDDAVRSWTPNNMNQLVTEQAGGALIFKGMVNEPATVTVGGKPAQVRADNRFEGQTVVPSGAANVEVKAADPSGNVRTSMYQVSQTAPGKSFVFDPNGNMTADGTKTYVWDAENRLVEVKQGATTLASFTYRADGIRTSKTAGGVTTAYVPEDDSVVEERAGGSVTRLFQGPGIDNVLASDSGAVGSYYVSDHLGSVRARTNASGYVVVARDYDPWGNPLAGAGFGGWSFTGREWDVETGLYYYRARFYDSALARYISSDPIGFDGGTNFYAYVSNAPTSTVDPFGLLETPGPKNDWECKQACIRLCRGRGGYKSHELTVYKLLLVTVYRCDCKCQKGKNKTGMCGCDVRPCGGENPPGSCPSVVLGSGDNAAACQADARNNLPFHCRKFLGHCKFHAAQR
jgi:RHS repeat-associated protein